MGSAEEGIEMVEEVDRKKRCERTVAEILPAKIHLLCDRYNKISPFFPEQSISFFSIEPVGK
jgi:hypothetical protein